MALIGFFGVILLLQVIAMLFHRLETLLHLLAFTEVKLICCKNRKEEKDKSVVKIVKEMQNLKELPSDFIEVRIQSPDVPPGQPGSSEIGNRMIERRPTITLDAALSQRIELIDKEKMGKLINWGGYLRNKLVLVFPMTEKPDQFITS